MSNFKIGQKVRITSGQGGSFVSTVEKFVLNNSHLYVKDSYIMWHRSQVKAIKD